MTNSIIDNLFCEKTGLNQPDKYNCVLLSDYITSVYFYHFIFNFLKVPSNDMPLNEIYHYENNNWINQKIDSCDHFHGKIFNFFYNPESFFKFKSEKILLYNNSSDNISFLFIEKEIDINNIINRFDRFFLNHINDLGVGFGEDGLWYTDEVIDRLFNLNMICNERYNFLKLNISRTLERYTDHG